MLNTTNTTTSSTKASLTTVNDTPSNGVIAGFTIHSVFIVIIIFLLIVIMRKLHMIPSCQCARLSALIKSRDENVSRSDHVESQDHNQSHGHIGLHNESAPRDDSVPRNDNTPRDDNSPREGSAPREDSARHDYNQGLDLKTAEADAIYGNCPNGELLGGHHLQPASAYPMGRFSGTPLRSSAAVDNGQEGNEALYYTNLNYVPPGISRPVSTQRQADATPTYFILEYETSGTTATTNTKSAPNGQDEARRKQRKKKKQQKIEKNGARRSGVEPEYANSSNVASASPAGRGEQIEEKKYQRIVFGDKEQLAIDLRKAERDDQLNAYSRIHSSPRQQPPGNGTSIGLTEETF